MTAAITPVPQHDGATITRAVAGERMMMDGGVAPLATVLQKLADRCEFAKDAVAFGRPVGASTLAVDPGGSNSSFTVRIGAISALVLYRNAALKVFSYAGGTIGVGKIQGGGNLANSDWYYVYAYDNAGTLDFEISTTEPNGNMCIKSGDSTRTYLGCFPTLSTGAPVPLRKVGNRVVYRASGGAVADLKVLDGASDTSYTAVACAALIPSHARLGSFRAQLVSTTGSAQNFAYFQANGDTGLDAVEVPVAAVVGASSSVHFDHETDSSQRLQYKVSNLTSAPDAYLWVHGFYE